MRGQALNLAVVLALTGLVALWWRARWGRVRPVTGEVFVRSELDAPTGIPLLVEFTAPGCAPCAQAREVLEAVAADRRDVAVLSADVTAHLALARRHRVLRAPTILVVDAQDRVRHRISGVPRASEVADLLAAGAERLAG